MLEYLTGRITVVTTEFLGMPRDWSDIGAHMERRRPPTPLEYGDARSVSSARGTHCLLLYFAIIGLAALIGIEKLFLK